MEETIHNEKNKPVSKPSETMDSVKRRKDVEAETALQEGKYGQASTLFKELADICFNLDEFDIAMRYLDKAEDAKYHASHRGESERTHVKYLMPLQVKVDLAIAKGDINQAKDLLNQMIAIAGQLRLIDLVKTYKKRLKEVAAIGS